MIETDKPKFDLEERTFKFAKAIIDFVKKLPRNNINFEYGDQLLRAAGSQGSNYIEANESLSKKDFVMRVKICRKETKEAIYWLKLVDINTDELQQERDKHIQEATELMKIFGAILEKCK